MKDSGLQHAMRALLGIIAGLLVAEMLQHLVAKVRSGTLGDTLLALAATLFLFRVVVDNILFYQLDDRTEKAYVRRILLIFLDLMSYGVLYFMVASLKERPQLTSVVKAMAIVEMLHALWCMLSLSVLDAIKSQDEDRKRMLRRWFVTSTFGAVFAGIVLAVVWKVPLSYDQQAGTVLAYAVIASLGYARRMKSSYNSTPSACVLTCPRCKEAHVEHQLTSLPPSTQF